MQSSPLESSYFYYQVVREKNVSLDWLPLGWIMESRTGKNGSSAGSVYQVGPKECPALSKEYFFPKQVFGQKVMKPAEKVDDKEGEKRRLPRERLTLHQALEGFIAQVV